MGTPVIGGDITGAVLEDSGLVVTGDLDDVGFLSGTDDDIWSITALPQYGIATIDANGTWTYDLDDTNPDVDGLDDGETLTDTFTVLMVDAEGESDTVEIEITITGVLCLAAETRVETAKGRQRVKDLRVGDRVLTPNGYKPLRWIGRYDMDPATLVQSPKMRPVRITAGALGDGLPERDLIVSRQHRMLVDTTIAKRMFGVSQVLISAIRLTALPGISVDETLDSVAYFHLLFDRHEVVFAEGAPTESLYPGPEAFTEMSAQSQQEVQAVLCDINVLEASVEPAYFIPPTKLQKELIIKHLQHDEPVIRSGSTALDTV